MSNPDQRRDVMPAVSTEIQDEDEISLLDLLLVVTENIRLLVIGPIVAGLAALGIGYTLTPMFTAKTILLPPQSVTSSTSQFLEQLGQVTGGLSGAVGAGAGATSAIMVYLDSDTVRDKVIEKFDLKKYYDAKLLTQARSALKGDTKATADRKSGTITLEVTNASASVAADIANYYVEVVRSQMGDAAAEKAKLQRENLERQVEEAMRKPYQSPFIRDAIVQGLIRQAEISRLDETRREGPWITQVDVAKPPERKSGPKKVQIAVITALATGFALLLFVFARNAMANAERDSESAAKISRIKRAFRLRG